MAAAAKIPGVRGGSNMDVAVWCEAAILTVPFDAVESLNAFASLLSDKLVLSAVNPLRFEGSVIQYALRDRSAAELAASALPRSRVATAFNNIPAAFFRGHQTQADVLVAADSEKTYEEAATLIATIGGLRPLYVGPLSQAQSVERLTAIILSAAALAGGPRLTVRFVPA
jgi:hypothetical protein